MSINLVLNFFKDEYFKWDSCSSREEDSFGNLTQAERKATDIEIGMDG